MAGREVLRATDAFKRFAELAKGKLEEAALEAIQDIAEQVVVRSPFKTGFLMSSWFVTLGNPATEGVKGVAAGAGASGVAMSRMSIALLDYKLGQTVWVQNGTVYARRLEFGFVGADSLGREFNQAPRGWVRGVLAEAPAIAEAAARRVAAGQSGGANPGGGGRRADVGYVAP